MSADDKQHTGIPGENGWDEKPSADQLGLTGDDAGREIPGTFVNFETGPTPSDEQTRLNRAITIIATDVPGLTYVAGATAEHGVQVEAIDVRKDLPFPMRQSGTVGLSSVESFITAVKRRGTSNGTTLWASEKKLAIEAIFNDVEPDSVGGLAGYRDDRALLKLEPHEDLIALITLSGELLPQEQFGDKLEELIHLVVDPDQADLLEIIDSVRMTTGSTFEQAIDRSNGEQTLSYREDNQVTAGRASNLTVPKTITFGVPFFEGADDVAYELTAWFRLRVINGQLHLMIKLKPYRRAYRAAWSTIKDRIGGALELPVFDAS